MDTATAQRWILCDKATFVLGTVVPLLTGLMCLPAGLIVAYANEDQKTGNILLVAGGCTWLTIGSLILAGWARKQIHYAYTVAPASPELTSAV